MAQEEIKKRKLSEEDTTADKSKSDAIKQAIEAAKKIKAKLEQKNTNENDGLNSSVEKNDKDNINNDPVTISPPNDDNTSKSPLYTRSLDISKSKHITLLSNTAFPLLLRSKLQLAPHEQFSAHTSGDFMILSASSEDILDLAEKELSSIQLTGQFRYLKPTKAIIIEKIPLGFDPLSTHISFLRGKLLGPHGSFLKHIQSSTRTRVQLRGKGSGYIEVVTSEAQEAMHLRVEGVEAEDVKEAKQLCEDLIATAKAEYESKTQKQIYNGYPQYPHQYQQYPQYQGYYQPYSPEQYYAMQQAYAQYYASQLTDKNKEKDLEKK